MADSLSTGVDDLAPKQIEPFLTDLYDVMASHKPQSKAYREAKQTLDRTMKLASEEGVAAFFQHAMKDAGKAPLPLHVTRRFFGHLKKHPDHLLESKEAILNKVVQDELYKQNAKPSAKTYVVGSALRVASSEQAIALFNRAIHVAEPPKLDLGTLTQITQKIGNQLFIDPIATPEDARYPETYDLQTQRQMLSVLTNRLNAEKAQRDALKEKVSPNNPLLKSKERALSALEIELERTGPKVIYKKDMYQVFGDRPEILQPKTDKQKNLAYLVKRLRGGPWGPDDQPGYAHMSNMYFEGQIDRTADRVIEAINLLTPEERRQYKDHIVDFSKNVSEIYLKNRNNHNSPDDMINGLRATKKVDQALQAHHLVEPGDSPVSTQHIAWTVEPSRRNVKDNDPQLFEKQIQIYGDIIKAGHPQAGYLALKLARSNRTPEQKSQIFGLVKQAAIANSEHIAQKGLRSIDSYLGSTTEQKRNIAELYNNEMRRDSKSARSLPYSVIKAIRGEAQYQRRNDVSKTLTGRTYKQFNKVGNSIVNGLGTVATPLVILFDELRHQVSGRADVTAPRGHDHKLK